MNFAAAPAGLLAALALLPIGSARASGADLPALARRRLVARGMRPEDIHGGDLCTISEPERFFSHRRDGRSGRIATLAWMQP